MAGELYTWTPAQVRAHKVLVEHGRDDAFTCVCDWHQFGGSHASHLVDELSKARVFVQEPRQHGTVDQLVRDVEGPLVRPATRPMTVVELLRIVHPDWTDERIADEARDVIEGR